MKAARLGASFWVPLVSLVVWFVMLLFPMAGMLEVMEQAAEGSGEAHLGNGKLGLTVKRDQFLPEALELAVFGAEKRIRTLYMPGYTLALLAFPSERLSGNDWTLSRETCRGLTAPWFCLWFWWLVGRGIDSMSNVRRMSWGLLLSGSVLSILHFLLALLLRFGMSAAERGDSSAPIWNLALWGGLFATAPLAWVLQRRKVEHLHP